MATEVLPTTAAIWLNNLCMADAASFGAATTQQTYSPVANLRNPLRTKRLRFTNVTGNSVDVDLGSSYTPGAAGGVRCFGLVDCNQLGGFGIKLYTVTGIGGTVVDTFSFTAYTRARINQTLRWYIGLNDSGASAAASRYYRIEVSSGVGVGGDDPDIIDSFHQIGNIWLGDFTEIGYDLGTKIQAKDPSEKSESRAGDVYHDIFPVYHTVDLTVPLLDASILYPIMKENLDNVGATGRVILDMHASEAIDYKRAHGCYYGRVVNFGENLRFSLHGDLIVSFEEDRRSN